MLQGDAFWAEKCWSYVSENGKQNVQPTDWQELEVYVDNMLVKSKEELTHLDDLEETFATLKKHQMKLNSSKCVFGVASGKLLGFMVS